MDAPLKHKVLYEKLFAASPDGIIVVDDTGKIVEANPQAETLFGYTRFELLGNAVEILIPERFRSVHAEDRSSFAHQSQRRPMGTGLELCGRRKDGANSRWM